MSDSNPVSLVLARPPRRWWRRLCALAAVVLGTLLLAFIGLSWWIGVEVRATAAAAQARYSGSPGEALQRLVADDSRNLRDRNRAVWALGQLGVTDAAPLLRSYLTGGPCDHAHALCQGELQKALKLIEGDFNAAALVWRQVFVAGGPPDE